ncbi:MAG: hypothetical protein KIT25_25730 [Enhydrobacter sp.]|nr:MAG: hypothetical protein KIT25_25730 [Enhydrobacter sp.]
MAVPETPYLAIFFVLMALLLGLAAIGSRDAFRSHTSSTPAWCDAGRGGPGCLPIDWSRPPSPRRD